MTEPAQVQLSVIWPDIDKVPVLRANAFLVQIEPAADGRARGVIISLGMVAPPAILGSPEEQNAALMALGAITSNTVARVSVDISHLRQLEAALQQQIVAIEAQLGGER